MKNKKKFAVASFVLSLLSLVPIIVNPDSLTEAQIFAFAGIILGIIGIILGFIGKRTSKGLSVSGIVIGIISCIALLLFLGGLFIFKNVIDCVDNGNKTSTCIYSGQELEVPNSMLRDDQMKK